MPTIPETLDSRITAYLLNGGLFNPEMADHNAVRDLLIECREALAQQAQPEAARAIHYPACWDTAAYPTIESALSEVYAFFKCQQCAPPADWRPFGLTVESALNRGDDPALLFDENSPIRDELRRLLAPLATQAKCSACLGSGEDWNEGDRCHMCSGSGRQPAAQPSPQAGARALSEARWPRNAAEVRDFIGSQFCSLKYGSDGGIPCDDDIYTLSAHDLLSAIDWWTGDDASTPGGDGER